MITHLNSEIYDTIYQYLPDKKDRQAWSNSHRVFYFLISNEKYIRLAQLIVENYRLITNINPTLPLWRQLKIAKVVLVGENHVCDLHRRLFARVAEMIWESGRWILLAEGGGKYLPGEGQLKYVSEEIAKTHETWDPISTSILAQQVETLRHNQLMILCKFLRIRDEKDDLKRSQRFDEILSDLLKLVKFEKEEMKSLVFTTTEIKKYLGHLNGSHGSKELYSSDVADTYFEISILIERLISNTSTHLKNLLAQSWVTRNSHMIENTETHVQTGKNVLTINGNDHGIDSKNPQIAEYTSENNMQPIEQLGEKKIPYVSLIPLEEIDIFSPSIISMEETQGKTTARELLKNYLSVKGTLEQLLNIRMKYWILSHQVLLDEMKQCREEVIWCREKQNSTLPSGCIL